MARLLDHPNCLLLVEGKNDFHVIHAICKRCNVPVRNKETPTNGEFSIVDCDGIENLLEQIPIRFKSSSNVKTIGIIVDADDDIASRWTSLQNIFSHMNFVSPTDFPEDGLILKQNGLTVGVWIMPNNNLNGMLEDFITFLVPNDDKLLPIVDSTLAIIEAQNLRKYSPVHKAKAKIHSWLSWQEEPGSPLAQSITKRYLTTNQETCLKLVSWMKSLFNC